VDLDRARRLLAKLQATRESPHAARYFRARIRLLAGEAEAAEKELDALITAGVEGDLYPFPMRVWRMRYTLSEAVRLEKARLLLAREEREEAKALLDRIGAAVQFRMDRLERTRPRELRRVEGVRDAGFEAGGLASDYFAGWYTYVATGSGKLGFSGDEKVKAEGERSLRVEIREPAKWDYGFHVRQEVRLPPSPGIGRRLRLGLSVRGEGIDWAKLEIMPSFGGAAREPIAAKPVPLRSGEWTRAEIEFDVPPELEFGLSLRFLGRKGGVLWLDDATRLPVEYVTIPREWSRLALARAFPDSLLAAPEPEAAGRGTARGAEVLIDPGFEAGTLAPMPLAGWYCGAAGKGLVEASPDPEVRTEGERSLRVEVLRPSPRGRPSVCQVITPAAGPAGLALAVDLRANRTTTVAVEVLEMGSFRMLARRHGIELAAGEWSREEVRFPLPADGSSVGLFLYVPEEVGTTLWLDNAALTPLEEGETPAMPAGPPARARKEGLADPSFESGALASRPDRGWFCGAATKGLARTAFDADLKTDGERSLRVEVVRPAELGRSSVCQAFPLPRGLSRPVFSVDLRTSGPASLVIQAIAMGVNRHLARREIELAAGEWTRLELPLSPDPDERVICVFVYLPLEPGTALWLDNAALASAR
jgi:hypothetical protein